MICNASSVLLKLENTSLCFKFLYQLRPRSSMNGPVCLSVCLSHFFHNISVIISSWNFQESLLLTKVMSMYFNSLRPSTSNMHHQRMQSLVHIMACRLIGTKPLSEPVIEYYQLETWEQISVKFESKQDNFLTRKCVRKCHLHNGSHFV